MTYEQEKQSDDKLTLLLQEFGKNVTQESQLPQDIRAQLIDRIVEASENTVVADISKAGWYETKRRPAAIIASSVLILMLAFVYLWRSPDGDGIVMPNIEKSFVEKNRDLMQVVLEYEAIMEHPLAWYVEQGNDVQFALLPDGAAGQASRVVFAELAIVKWHDDSTLRTASETYFLMIRDNQPLELFSKDGSMLKMLFWLYPVDDNLFAYELVVNGKNGLDKTASISGLIKPETTTDDGNYNGEYRVFLRVHPT